MHPLFPYIRPASMSTEQDRILSTLKLTLSQDIVRGQLRDPYMILKNVKSGAYLTVDKDQWRILQRFKDGATVATVLPQLILNRTCPRLRHFYELILKAEQADMLVHDKKEVQRMFAADWRGKVNWEFVQLASAASLVFTLLALLIKGIEAPTIWWQWLLLWPAMMVIKSIGFYLAAGVLRFYDCEVYKPRLSFFRLFPSFAIDVRDARMGGKECEIAVSMARLIPLVLAPGIACFVYPPLVLPLLLGLFYSINPFTRNPGMHILVVLFRKLRSSTEHEPLFVHERAWKVIVSGGNRLENKRFLMAHWGHTIAWITLLYSAVKSAFDIQSYRVLNFIDTIGPVQFLIMSLIVLAALTVVPAVGRLITILFTRRTRPVEDLKQRRSHKRKYHGSDPNKVPVEDVQGLMGDSLLFHDCSDETIAQIAKCVNIEQVRRGTVICRENEPGDTFYIVYSGKVEVLKEMPAGRPEQVCVLKPGDGFGEIALLRDVPRTRTVRALQATILLSLERNAFEKMLIPSISSDRIQQILQKLSFLNRIELCREWPVRALQLFASRAVFKDVATGERVIQSGTANQYFYVVYEGSFNVMMNGKRQNRLRIGDFFGEISLLQSSLSTADVVAHIDSRLLVVNKTDFLNLMGWDHFIGMQFEKISSERLHEPIFPLKGRSFEAIDAM